MYIIAMPIKKYGIWQITINQHLSVTGLTQLPSFLGFESAYIWCIVTTSYPNIQAKAMFDPIGKCLGLLSLNCSWSCVWSETKDSIAAHKAYQLPPLGASDHKAI